MSSYQQNFNSISVCLNDTNYPTWVYLMHHFLRSRGLLKFVDGSFSDSKTTASERWFEQDSVVITLITASLCNEALTLVIGCQTSMEVWSTLKQHYAPNSEFHIMKLKTSLHTIRKGSDSIDKYLLRFKDVQNQLDVIGNKVSDGDLKAFIFAGLPHEYAHTRQIIRSKGNVSMEEVRLLLLSGEYELGLKQQTSFMFHSPTRIAQTGMVDHTFQKREASQHGGKDSGVGTFVINKALVESNSTEKQRLFSSTMPSDHNDYYGSTGQYGSSISEAQQFNLPKSGSHVESFSQQHHCSQDTLPSIENGKSIHGDESHTSSERNDKYATPFKKASSSIPNAGKMQTCRRDQYAPTLSCYTPKALSATMDSYSKPPSMNTQLVSHASRSQVKPLQFVTASPLSSISFSSLQQPFTKPEAFPTSNDMLHSCVRKRSPMFCRQGHNSKIGQSLPLIPPG